MGGNVGDGDGGAKEKLLKVGTRPLLFFEKGAIAARGLYGFVGSLTI